MPATSAYYEFGDFALDVGQQCLLRRDTGQTTLLTAKVLDTLVYFVEHAGETLDKDVLLRSIWPGTIVEENSLTQNVSTLRQMLGEARGENRYIATVPRKGYRFVAQGHASRCAGRVEHRGGQCRSPHECGPGTARRRKILLGAGAAVLIAAIAAIALFAIAPARREAAPLAGQTLAILPFKPLLPAERNESLELGMAESLISSLSQHSRAGDQSLELGAPLRGARPGSDCGGSRAGRRYGARRFVAASRRSTASGGATAARSGRTATVGAELRSGLHDDLRRARRHCRPGRAGASRCAGSAAGRHAALRTRRIPKRTRSTRAANSPGRGRPNRACCRRSASSSKPLRGIRTTRSPTRALPTATLSSASSACALLMKCFPRRAVRWKRRCRSIRISRRPIRRWDTSR